MKSVKNGRGPSIMSGVGGVFAAVFGLIWLIAAVSIGAPWFMAAFGAVFILAALSMAAYQFHSGTAKNRPSIVDIVDENEEPDPLNEAWGRRRFCAGCGQKLPENARFCPSCGEKIDQ